MGFKIRFFVVLIKFLNNIIYARDVFIQPKSLKWVKWVELSGLAGVASCYNWLHVVTKVTSGYNWLQVATRGYKWL